MKIYREAHEELVRLLQHHNQLTETETLRIHRLHFKSKAYPLLPGQQSYHCSAHAAQFDGTQSFVHDIGTFENQIQINDIDIAENQQFDYYLFEPKNRGECRKALFLFHGFNEKNWDKYLTWAQFLAETTGCPVVLFPLAFHMNRTLAIWSDKRLMFAMSEKRREMFPDIVQSSLTNVAISMRLHSRPQRFIWSGLQSYYDVIDLIAQVRAGDHPVLHPDTCFHIVAYSIGCLLAEILKLANPNDYFGRSKVCLFCGGPVFNRLSPVSKFIIDSEANVALYSYLIEHLDQHLKHDPHLQHYIKGPHREGQIFHAMLNYNINREFREELFRQAAGDFMAIGLKNDEVIPSYEVVNTLQGAARDIPIAVRVLDYEYDYSHIMPFPLRQKDETRIDARFRETFQQIADFVTR